MLLYKPKYKVKINLERDEIFFNGSAEESESQELNGVLEVSLLSGYKPPPQSIIHLSLTCNLSIKTKELFAYDHKQYLFNLSWSFKVCFDSQKTSKFLFLAKLPRDLPASLDLDNLKISYQFRAYEECFLLQHTIMTRDIQVFRLTRVPRPDYTFTHATAPEVLVKANGQLAGYCKYSLSYPMTWYDMNKAIPIELRLALNQDQRVYSVIYSIRQAVSLGTLKQNDMNLKSEYQYQLSTQDAYKIPSKTFPESFSQINISKNSSKQSDSLLCFKLVSNLQPYIENQRKFVNLSSNNNEIKIEHYLLAQITVLNSDGELVSEVVKLPLTFLKRPKFNENFIGPPPKYEEA
ncbi:hypothetical protein CONCODRAFT_71097 [Conidiobolus coronatus NRRL 28638]|uniref:Arrestin C-terminal-like domain-containing protein n=1 Tax=Conidiobolus coronatus (strain ATCC 28846 / CBS 209.66 / NRRL 28638) TaxID=796925 RepID=A0A137P4J6_CONC2|nr:hypothetical protein CONCODRAFT_71097 [Conidiobolus coronatus NRRL 28638]|eukprot:KXN69938.1 hypothetical protein CONCODRAFT_71097 [Conidiobolus coronatus NRRL 28638]